MQKEPSSRKQNAFAEAENIFREHGGVLRTMEAIHHGVHPRTLYAMRDAGTLERLGRGLYRLADLPPLGNPDLVTVALRVPEGVFCLISALAFHEIATQIPHEVYVALKRGAERPRLEHPPVRVFWFTGRAFTEGIETHTLDGVDVRVYGAAKTVADAAVEVLVTGNVGPKAYSALKAAGIDVRLCAGGTVTDALRQFKAGALPPADQANVEGHWGS